MPCTTSQILNCRSLEDLLIGSGYAYWWLLLRYYCVTTALLLRYYCVTTALHQRYYCVTTALHQRYYRVTTALHKRYYRVTTALHQRYYRVTTALHERYYSVTQALLLRYYSFFSACVGSVWGTFAVGVPWGLVWDTLAVRLGSIWGWCLPGNFFSIYITDIILFD